jgi:RNA polymerase I-specific transcription initiation factor RRN3
LACLPQVLYASVQAILYVLCYHMEALLNPAAQHQGQQQQQQHKRPHQPPQQPPSSTTTPTDVCLLVRERVLPLLHHPLQPLNVCLPSVVAEFKHQVQAARIANLSNIAPQVGVPGLGVWYLLCLV